MTKKLVLLVVLASFSVAILAASAFSKAAWDRGDGRAATGLTVKLTDYSFPQVASKPAAWGDRPDFDNAITTYPHSRSSLGTARAPMAVESPGFTVIESYNDDQQFPGGNRQVDFNWRSTTDPSIHFVYGAATGSTVLGKFGYNVYNPLSGGDWPRGAGVGCEIQPADQEGLWPQGAVNPDGFIIIAGVDDALGGGVYDNHYFAQTSQHGCYWGSGSQILSTQYNVNFLEASNYLGHPRIEIQDWMGDTITHIIAIESEYTIVLEGNPFDIRANSLNYFQKRGNLMEAGTAWTGPFTLDSMNSSSEVQNISNGAITASTISPQVAVAYTHNHEQAYAHNQRYDVEVFMRVNDSIGMADQWGPIQNVTNYSRVEPSACAFINCHAIYDSEGYLHIVWTAAPTVANVYDDPIFFWGDFSASIYHWTNRVAGPNEGGTIVRAHNADWGIEWNTQVCGWGAPGVSYIGYESITECDGRLYIFFSQWLDAMGDWGAPQIDDCASSFTDRYFAANGENCMVVSSSLDGILWDFSRNLTNTYTAECDSIGWGGVCMNDKQQTVPRFGMDSAAYGAELTFPGDELVIPANGTWDSSLYMHVFYTEDHYPAPGWRSVDTYNEVTLNPLKWMRIPCVEPIEAPQIYTASRSLGWPNYIKPGEDTSLTITIVNDGNVTLHVNTIEPVEYEGGPTGWLTADQTSLTINAGVLNTETFVATINGNHNVNSPGTVIPLYGEIYLLSDAENFDSLVIEVDYIQADTVIGLEFDTLYTSATALLVSNIAEMGYSNNATLGGLNLDYTSSGTECDTLVGIANTYLYSGGPLLMKRHAADSFDLNFAMHQQNFDTEVSWRRVDTLVPSVSLTGPNYTGFSTGMVVNTDTTIALERTYYAPTGGGDSADFIVTRTIIYSFDGNTHSNLLIGETVDWDLPSGDGSETDNTAGDMPEYGTAYIRGSDSLTVPECQLHERRWASNRLLGWYLASEFNDFSCAGHCDPLAYRADLFHDWWDSLSFYDSITPDFSALWDSLSVTRVHEDTADDFAIMLTFANDVVLEPTDSIVIWQAVTSVRDGDLAELEGNLDAAFNWYFTNFRDTECPTVCGCCIGMTGNVDGDEAGIIDIGDLTALIAYLFIPPNPVPDCMNEANVDGDVDGVIDIGDLTALIAYLFIPPNPLPSACQ